MTIAPVIVDIAVKAPPERAFEVFAGDIGRWWPRRMAVGGVQIADLVLEPFAGGRWFQRDPAGGEIDWGRVLAWEPPRRLLLAWQLDANFTYDSDFLTHVEVTFAADGASGCRVRLEHRDMQRFGSDAERMAGNFAGGWTGILQSFADLAAASAP